ncbi:uncharacterized protein LOC130672956 isoform X2 [Microplitis mediator]|uniref:uncharacterized protein LOC130672956 isoform X2 n=1 Tax=Microplitis mediator TaxID=375433 RepID=UPI00255643B3|nr:uncharacterized protein LOC130672956 isoform X2 [Microplitis mediator]
MAKKKMTLPAIAVSDHDYASSCPDNLFNFEGVNYDPTNGQVSVKDLNLTCDSAIKPQNELTKSFESVEDIDLGISDTDIEQLSSIDDMFNNLNDDLDDNEPIDFLKPNDSPVESIDLFNDLDNGICVHVNSGRVSLEFCSACHYNSVNSNGP